MRIALDYTPAIRQGAGVGRVVRSLTRALADSDRANDYTLVVAAGTALPSADTWPARFRFRQLPLTERAQATLWGRLSLPLSPEPLVGRQDVWHGVDYLLPPLYRTPGLVSVHDVSFLARPDCAEPSLARYLAGTVPRSVQRAALVITGAEAAKADLCQWLKLAPERVRVVPDGVDPAFFRSGPSQRPAGDPPYILSVGTIEPRKNGVGLIAAYERLRADHGYDGRLLFVGGAGWQTEAFYQRLKESPARDGISLLGRRPDDEVAVLMRAADLFAFPSVYEGFGLPPLEAMACGAPVVAGDIPVLREVLGDAAQFAPPTDAEALAGAMARVLSDPALRAQLVAHGRQQAARFTWRASAERQLAVYAEVAG